MSEGFMISNIIFSMEQSFSIEDIELEFEKMNEEFDEIKISEALEIYVKNGLINEDGSNYELALSVVD